MTGMQILLNIQKLIWFTTSIKKKDNPNKCKCSSTDEQIKTVLYPYNEILLRDKKEWTLDL